ncbi:MAG TPA: helix-turn-helix transcriptional regulator [Acidobacteriota bacterium]|nr:helix-turn-helix transcriptional regulator [Acidobacteriota bacterium]
MTENTAATFLPLRPDVFTILLVLLDGDCHGYGMIKAAEERQGRKGQLQPGGLYRLLKQLLDSGMVEQLPAGAAPADSDERRRYYRITPFGREVAAAEARRMAELVEMSARHRLLEERESS